MANIRFFSNVKLYTYSEIKSETLWSELLELNLETRETFIFPISATNQKLLICRAYIC